jgi:hypothetical protein
MAWRPEHDPVPAIVSIQPTASANPAQFTALTEVSIHGVLA